MTIDEPHHKPPPPLLQSTTSKLNLSPSSFYCHGKESSSTLGIMKLRYDLVVCEMIHICVLIKQFYCFHNWQLIAPHNRLSWLGHIVDGLIRPSISYLSEPPNNPSHGFKGTSFLFSAWMSQFGCPLFRLPPALPFVRCG